MAITKLNSLAIPDDTIVEADLSYPLTNFSSTGIDDNASATKLTVDSTGISVGGAVQGDSLVAYAGLLELDDNGTHNGQINAPASLFINIDSDNNNTGEAFVVAKDRSTLSGGTELFRISENGRVGIGTADTTGRMLSVYGTGDLVELRSTNSGAGGAQLDLIHDTASPANADSVGIINFANPNAQMANITAKCADVGANYGELHFGTRNGGTYNFTNMMINRSGYVGIGSDNPRYNLSVKGSNATAVGIAVDNDTGGCQLDVAALGSSYNAHGAQANEAWLFCANNINLGSATGQSSAVKFLSGGSENARIDADGIKFNADTAAANGLDDYEEGTWTPTTPNGSWTVHEATYTKIGRFVHCRAYVTASSSGITSADFGGLPFSVYGSYGSGSVGYNNYLSGEVISVLVQANTLFNFRIGQTQYGVAANSSAMFSFQYETS